MHLQQHTLILNGGFTLNNQIDLGKIYGIEGAVGSAQDLEPLNFLTSEVIPSLEQIAEYNLASRGINPDAALSGQPITQQLSTTDFQTGLPNQGVDFDTNLTQNDVPFVSTPTTTRNAAMNMTASSNAITQGGNTSITDFSNPFPVTAESIQYLNGFIRTQIGRRIRVTFLIGSNMTEEKEGYLLGVGANYILMNELDTDDLTACDFYNIKFITFFY